MKTTDDLTESLVSAFRSARTPHRGGECTDPGCARHAGTTAFPAFPTARRAGADFGDAVAEAWYRSGNNRLDIPAGIVAALALWPTKSEGAAHAPALASYVAAQPPRVLVRGFADCAGYYWALRPDLIDVASPILAWMEEDLDESVLRGITAVTHAALSHGVLQYTGDSDPYHRSTIDLMSWTITALRHHSSRKGLGEYHTPPDVTALLTDIVIGDQALPEPGNWSLDPAAGTGGMFRALAQCLREQQLDPRAYGWMMQEIDPIAAAGAATNALIWDLGPRAVVACGDTLAKGDLYPEAVARGWELAEYRDRLRSIAGNIAATAAAHRLLDDTAPCDEPVSA